MTAIKHLLLTTIDSDGWTALEGRNILNEVIELSRVSGSVPMLHRNNWPVFSHCKTLIVSGGDKNWCFYWLDREVFPSVETIVLIGISPCDPLVLTRFPSAQWYVLEDQYNYVTRWAPKATNMHRTKHRSGESWLRASAQSTSSETKDSPSHTVIQVDSLRTTAVVMTDLHTSHKWTELPHFPDMPTSPTYHGCEKCRVRIIRSRATHVCPGSGEEY